MTDNFPTDVFRQDIFPTLLAYTNFNAGQECRANVLSGERPSGNCDVTKYSIRIPVPIGMMRTFLTQSVHHRKETIKKRWGLEFGYLCRCLY